MDIQLNEPTFRLLRDFIYEKSGIFIPDSKKYLVETRLSRRLQEQNFRGYEDYLQYVKSGNNTELPKLFDAVTTNETYFFREPQHFDVLFDALLPRIMNKKGKKEIRIWSAACSTGEEPYTVSMMLRERAADIRPAIFATDISEAALVSARAGVYNSYSIRNVPEPYLKKYFRSGEKSLYELDSSVRVPVAFSNLNLVDDKKMKAMRGIDVVFCRNVLIYFDEKAKQKAVSTLYDSIETDGYLFVGMSESLHSVTRALRPMIFNKVVVYQKV